MFISEKHLTIHKCYQFPYNPPPVEKHSRQKVFVVKNFADYYPKAETRKVMQKRSVPYAKREWKKFYTESVAPSTSRTAYENYQISQAMLPKMPANYTSTLQQRHDTPPMVQIKKEVLSEDESTEQIASAMEPLKGLENIINNLPEKKVSESPKITVKTEVFSEEENEEEDEERIQEQIQEEVKPDSLEPLKGIEGIINQISESKQPQSTIPAPIIQKPTVMEPLKGIEKIVKQLPGISKEPTSLQPNRSWYLQKLNQISKQDSTDDSDLSEDDQETIEKNIIEYVRGNKDRNTDHQMTPKVKQEIPETLTIEQPIIMEQTIIKDADKTENHLESMVVKYEAHSDSSQDEDRKFIKAGSQQDVMTPSITYKCAKCPQLLFMKQAAYKDHLMDHYKSGSNFMCDECGKVVKTFFHLGTHMAMAHGLKLL